MTESAAEAAAKGKVVSRVVLIWFVLLGFLAIVGATAAANTAAAQGLAACTASEDCSLTGAVVTDDFPTRTSGRDQRALTSRYGAVPPSPPVSVAALPHQRTLPDRSPTLPTNTSLPLSGYRGWRQTYEMNGPIVLSFDNRRLLAPEPLYTVKPADAFSYDLGRRWRFRADALDDNSVALQAIAAGTKRIPEDLLWHLSKSDFSINMGLTRRF